MSAPTPGRDCLRVEMLHAAAVSPESFNLWRLLHETAQEYADLLAACEEFCRAMDDREDLDLLDMAETSARAAIAKARGADHA